LDQEQNRLRGTVAPTFTPIYVGNFKRMYIEKEFLV